MNDLGDRFLNGMSRGTDPSQLVTALGYNTARASEIPMCRIARQARPRKLLMSNPSKPPGNVVDLIPAKLGELIEAFKTSGSLDDFLRVLSALVSLKVDVPEVWKTWKRLNKEIEGKGVVRAVLTWIATLDISICASATTTVPTPSLPSTEQSDRNSKWESLYKALHELEKYIEAKLADPANPYGPFAAELPFETILPSYAIIDESARLIGQHIQALYNNEAADADQLSEVATPVHHPNIIKFIEHDLLPWAFDTEQGYWQRNPCTEADSQLLQLEHLEELRPHLFSGFNLSNSDTFPPGFSAGNLARAIPYLPQPLLVWILNAHYLDEGFVDVEGSAELVDVLLSLPLEIPLETWDQFWRLVPEHSVLRDYAKDLPDMGELPALPIKNYAVLIDELGTEGVTGGTTAVTNIAFDQQFSDDPKALTPTRLRELIESGIGRLTQVRRANYRGRTPFTRDEAAQMGVGLSEICERLDFSPQHDISYLVGITEANMGFGRHPFSSSRIVISDISARSRSDNYLLVFNAAIDEGWHEFATASLAFFLFSQPLMHDHELHTDWHRLAQALQVASSLPGFSRVRHAAALALEIISTFEKAGSLDVLCLSGWAGNLDEDKDVISDKLDRVLTHPQIQKELVEMLGAEAWIKLSLLGKRQLVDAEALWSSMHMHVGRGQGDYGSLATSYVKVLEGEILDRMRPVVTSQAFMDYHRQAYKRDPEKHVGLGLILHLLRDFEQLPPSLQDTIRQSQVRLQEDRGLLNGLFKVMQYRNKGAHAGEFNEKEFFELRKLLFQNQALKRFLELL